MRIVNIAGGLGNQMFQFAFALMLKNHFPDEVVKIDTQHYHTLFFKHFGSVNLHNGFEIEQVFPHASLPIANRNDLMRLTYYIPNYVMSRIARRILPVRKTEYIAPYSENFMSNDKVFTDGDTYYEGYWQCVNYYLDMKEQLRQVFAHGKPDAYNTEMIRQIKSTHSVGIHVRRGDYKNAPDFNGICTMDYYRKAISQASSDHQEKTFFVFSNDIPWCLQNIKPLIEGHNVMFVDGNRGKNSCWDMFLMTYCSELIIANSSFSWWGAFLNENAKKIYAPEPWLRRDCKIEIHDPQWVRIN